jgi:hypothetical protein
VRQERLSAERATRQPLYVYRRAQVPANTRVEPTGLIWGANRELDCAGGSRASRSAAISH